VPLNGSESCDNGLHVIQGWTNFTYFTLSTSGVVSLKAGATLSIKAYSHTDTSWSIDVRSA
jgi:hypothetical protein